MTFETDDLVKWEDSQGTTLYGIVRCVNPAKPFGVAVLWYSRDELSLFNLDGNAAPPAIRSSRLLELCKTMEYNENVFGQFKKGDRIKITKPGKSSKVGKVIILDISETSIPLLFLADGDSRSGWYENLWMPSKLAAKETRVELEDDELPAKPLKKQEKQDIYDFFASSIKKDMIPF